MVGYLYPVDHNLRRTRKSDKDLARDTDFKDKRFPGKIRDCHKIEKRIAWALLFLVTKIRKKYLIYVSRNTLKIYVDLLLIGEEGKRHHVFLKDFSTFMYDHALYRGRKYFCR